MSLLSALFVTQNKVSCNKCSNFNCKEDSDLGSWRRAEKNTKRKGDSMFKKGLILCQIRLIQMKWTCVCLQTLSCLVNRESQLSYGSTWFLQTFGLLRSPGGLVPAWQVRRSSRSYHLLQPQHMAVCTTPEETEPKQHRPQLRGHQSKKEKVE